MRTHVFCLAGLIATAPAHAQLWDRFQKMINPEVEVQLTHPPELGIRIQRLAFATASTPIEADLIQALIGDLSSTGEIEILDRANVDRILREQKFSNSGMVDEKTAVELGKLLGSPALMIVKVHHFNFNKTQRQEVQTKKEKVDKKEVETKVTTYFTGKQGDFVASIQAVDLATGKIYSAKRIVASPSLENKQQDTAPDPPSDAQIREMAIAQAVSLVRKMVLPWAEARKLVFYDDSDYSMKEAYGRLKIKDYPGALVAARQSLGKAKADPNAKPKYLGRTNYNIGICHFILGDYESALPFLKLAQDTDIDSGIYRDAVNECSRGLMLQKELRKATQKGGMTIPEPPPVVPPATKQESSAKPQENPKPSVEERLQKLDGLFKKGLISEDDFKKRKDEILKEI
jgi:tetratricopeptide (TPR) repeat protein